MQPDELTPRERVHLAPSHREPDREPADFMAMLDKVRCCKELAGTAHWQTVTNLG